MERLQEQGEETQNEPSSCTASSSFASSAHCRPARDVQKPPSFITLLMGFLAPLLWQVIRCQRSRVGAGKLRQGEERQLPAVLDSRFVARQGAGAGGQCPATLCGKP